jgi:hypothetical protein
VTEKMQNVIASVFGLLVSFSSGPQQEQPRELKGGGHLLGETAEHFFSEGSVGQLLRACKAGDWKAVKQLARAANPDSKPDAKDLCAKATLVKQQATSGERQEYGGGDHKTMRTDTFILDGGYLVKIMMVFDTSSMDVEGYHPKYFAELFAGLREAYGEPSKSYSEPVFDGYGVKYDAHRAEWVGKQDVITIIEHPGRNGRTEIVVETLAEHNRATKPHKTENPLQQESSHSFHEFTGRGSGPGDVKANFHFLPSVSLFLFSLSPSLHPHSL